MRLARVETAAGPRWVDLDLGEAGGWATVDGDFSQGFVPDGGRVPPGPLLAPVAPTKIVCVARNYPAHAAEMGGVVADEPRLFLKPPSAIIGPDAPIRLPARAERVDPEGELCAVIGARLVDADPAAALAGVFGYTCLNDVSARDLQKKDGIFGRAKGFDTFCPVGPWVVTGLDASDLEVGVTVNDEPRSRGRTSEMVVSVGELISYISHIMTLEPGDLIATGTPPGVAPLAPGDVVTVVIAGIGALRNPVVRR